MKAGFTVLFFYIHLLAFSQKVYVAKVCDADTKLPLKGVKVSLDAIYTTSNLLGFFQVNGDTSNLITAELAGFDKLSFKLPQADRFVFYLRKTESESDRKKAQSFYKHLGEKIKYPAEARRANIQGTAVVYFEVDTLGKILDNQAIKTVGFGCTEEVLRALKNAPEVWYSIKQHSKFQLRVVFKIADLLFPTENLDLKAPDGVILLPEIVVVAHKQTTVIPIRP